MNLHQCLYIHLLFPTLNHCLNPQYHHLIVDHLVETYITWIFNNQIISEVANIETGMAYNEELYPPTPQDI